MNNIRFGAFLRILLTIVGMVISAWIVGGILAVQRVPRNYVHAYLVKQQGRMFYTPPRSIHPLREMAEDLDGDGKYDRFSLDVMLPAPFYTSFSYTGLEDEKPSSMSVVIGDVDRASVSMEVNFDSNGQVVSRELKIRNTASVDNISSVYIDSDGDGQFDLLRQTTTENEGEWTTVNLDIVEDEEGDSEAQ